MTMTPFKSTAVMDGKGPRGLEEKKKRGRPKKEPVIEPAQEEEVTPSL